MHLPLLHHRESLPAPVVEQGDELNALVVHVLHVESDAARRVLGERAQLVKLGGSHPERHLKFGVILESGLRHVAGGLVSPAPVSGAPVTWGPPPLPSSGAVGVAASEAAVVTVAPRLVLPGPHPSGPRARQGLLSVLVLQSC